ncbi:MULTISPECIES: DHA2 family efflux MFS transporter permease subunit [Brucella/Ochrobactrum group]|uniref:Drug resistance transporter, Bcr/CflA family n=1 Tax=Ochrobactrum soli TaxID=2448455 RepID=A0A2P9HGQ4_9HYPH|nr:MULTISPECIES: DHA2 family efflux MFS transporter permease subunit [Brucella]MCI1002802.1 DHA2 family efflux MFS transporter permease subunit [Ochrobactrum sp. C6C9]RRD24588.1 DHA2 family efflux MFS transporter permease subunit [Brucellaceae bacterium VT-16-1752]WHT43189.1 DHA2 family efflux MFS transporter permease subunit [Ochrobactrum sp. SSR]MDX4073406.1 DHA2 family efflux MFS transporter permease subunit [Brucella sp. NBRC 113783]RLL74059.1 DHA2 family efflux MFS transporter permease su
MNRIIPLVLAIALFMEQMDSNVISTSLPAIAADIGTSPIALKLALTAYLVALAVFIPVSGWMADRFGAKNVFRAAIAVFVVGSIACAAANSLTAFVVARFLQGMGGAMMTPVGRLVLIRSTPRSELVSAMAWLTIPAMVGPLVGPPVGGFITTFLTWHWIFLINVPIGAVGIWFATRFLPDNDERIVKRLDWPGFVLSGIAMSGVVFGLSVVSLPALPPAVGLVTLAVGLICSVLYIGHARRSADPLLDLRLFDNQVFRSAVFGGSIFRFGIGAIPFLLPLMFQLGFGFSPFQSGMITFVSAIGAISMKFGAKRIFARIGFRRALMAGSIISAGFIAVNSLFTPATPIWFILGFLLVGGFARSLFFTGVNALAYAEIPDEKTSQATPMTAVAQQVSLAIGVALAGGVLEISSGLRGAPLALVDFHVGFIVVALVSAVAFFWFARLSPDAGHELAGPTVVKPKSTERAVVEAANSSAGK